MKKGLRGCAVQAPPTLHRVEPAEIEHVEVMSWDGTMILIELHDRLGQGAFGEVLP